MTARDAILTVTFMGFDSVNDVRHVGESVYVSYHRKAETEGWCQAPGTLPHNCHVLQTMLVSILLLAISVAVHGLLFVLPAFLLVMYPRINEKFKEYLLC